MGALSDWRDLGTESRVGLPEIPPRFARRDDGGRGCARVPLAARPPVFSHGVGSGTGSKLPVAPPRTTPLALLLVAAEGRAKLVGMTAGGLRSAGWRTGGVEHPLPRAGGG